MSSPVREFVQFLNEKLRMDKLIISINPKKKKVNTVFTIKYLDFITVNLNYIISIVMKFADCNYIC